MKHKDSNDAKIKNSRTTFDKNKMNNDLEEQFSKSLHSKLANNTHSGLGFSGKVPQNTHKKFEDNEDEDENDKLKIKNESTVKNVNNESSVTESKLKFKKMSFVKSSS